MSTKLLQFSDFGNRIRRFSRLLRWRQANLSKMKVNRVNSSIFEKHFRGSVWIATKYRIQIARCIEGIRRALLRYSQILDPAI
jgi:hypothetical protein